jgi:hypothetical protein
MGFTPGDFPEGKADYSPQGSVDVKIAGITTSTSQHAFIAWYKSTGQRYLFASLFHNFLRSSFFSDYCLLINLIGFHEISGIKFYETLRKACHV